MQQISKTTAAPRARITGVVYLLYFLTAIFGAFLDSRKLVVYAYTANLISDALYITLTLLFYYLFKPVNRNLSLVAAVLSLLGCAVTVLSRFDLAPLHLSPLLFFGPYCLLIGYLILRSTFLPRILGVLMMIAGIGWLLFLTPLETYLSLYLKILGILAEGSLMLWLIVMGVNTRRWQEQAAA
jgi:hypothetical protein